MPCLRPALERWFQVTVLVEHSASMGLWQELSREFHRMLASAGAFSAVRGYRLEMQGQPALYPLHVPQGVRPKAVPTSQLRDPRGRTLILVVTDCVSAAWSDGRAGQLLSGLGTAGPVAVVQVFPGSLLERTALAEALPLWLRATVPGAVNAKLMAVQQDGLWPLPAAAGRYLKLPVLTLEPQSLSLWARMLAAAAGVWVGGYALELPAPGKKSAEESSSESPDPPDPLAAAVQAPAETLSAAARVSAFRLSATPMARQLARLMTVFCGSGFSLPILRLVRQVMLPQARPHHEAEVLLSGLLEALPHSAEFLLRQPERVQYDFFPAVPELLDAMPTGLQREPRLDKGSVLESLTRYVAQRLGSVRDFMTVVSALSALAQGQKEFARLSHELLRRLGARYAALATAPAAPLLEWSAPDHPRRNRVELAAYLGDPLATSLIPITPPAENAALDEWLLGLRRWGTLVLADAALLVAQYMLDRAGLGPDLSAGAQTMLRCGRECLENPSPQRIEAARAAVQSLPNAACSAEREVLAIHACMNATSAAVVPWHEEQPHGDSQKGLVLASLSSAQRVLGPLSPELRDAVTRHLIKQLLNPASYIPNTPRDNGKKILFGGDLGKLSDQLDLTAATLGSLCAASGYELLYQGVTGVERKALRAYVAERERTGSPSEHLRVPLLLEGPRQVRDLLRTLQSTRGPSSGGLSPYDADATVLLGETPYVSWLCQERLEKHLPVLPLPWTGREAHRAFKQFWDQRDRYQAFEARQLGFIDSWWEPDAEVQTQAQRVIEVLDVCFLGPRQTQYRRFALYMFRLLVLSAERADALLPGSRFYSYAASLASAAFRAEVPLDHIIAAEYLRPDQTESELLRRHLGEATGYAKSGEPEQVRAEILSSLSALLPAMREWLAFDFATIAELIDTDSTFSPELVGWLVPLVVEHAWPLARSSLLSAQFRTPAHSRSLTLLLGVVRGAHASEEPYQKEVIQIAVTWAQMYLEVLAFALRVSHLRPTAFSPCCPNLCRSGCPAVPDAARAGPRLSLIGLLLNSLAQLAQVCQRSRYLGSAATDAPAELAKQLTANFKRVQIA